jgi:hypothetical protein
MEVTSVLKEQHAAIRRAFWRAAVPGRRRDGEFRRLVRMLATHEAAEQVHVHPTARRLGRTTAAAPTRPHPRVNGALANRLAMPVLGPADRLRDLASEKLPGRDRSQQSPW